VEIDGNLVAVKPRGDDRRDCACVENQAAACHPAGRGAGDGRPDL
jgi:hypothetical protein